MSFPLSSRPPGPTAITSPCDNFSLAFGDDDAAGGFLLSLDTTDEDTIVQGTELHKLLLSQSSTVVRPVDSPGV
jgi:hypothetical protein